MLAWAESPLRLKWPLKRTGPRGSGLYERITWDEAIDIASSKLRDAIDRFGNDAVFIAYGTNANCTTARPFNRLMNCLGGPIALQRLLMRTGHLGREILLWNEARRRQLL